MFVFSLFTSNNATSLGEGQIGQHIMPFNIMLPCYGLSVCTISYLLLGRVDLRAQRAIVIKLSRGRPVGLCVGLSSALWKNGGSDLDAVWYHRSDGCRYEAGSGVCGSVHAKGYFWGRIWGAPLQPMGTLRRTCRLSQRRGPLPKLLWADLLCIRTVLRAVWRIGRRTRVTTLLVIVNLIRDR